MVGKLIVLRVADIQGSALQFFEVIVLPMFREAVGIFVELKAYLAAAEKNHRMWRNMVASNLTVNDIHHRMDNRDPVLKIQVGPTFGDGYEQGLITALREDR